MEAHVLAVTSELRVGGFRVARDEQSEASNVLHKSLHDAMHTVFSSDSLLALFLERKLRKSGVRLSASERESLRKGAAEYSRTEDASILLAGVKRKRDIHIEITDADLQEFGKIVTKAADEQTVAGIKKYARTISKDARQWADDEVEWTAAIRGDFEARLAWTWRKPFQHYARFQRMAAYIGQLAAAHFNDEKLLASSRTASALLMLHARACAVAGEVETLIHSGFADGAAARWRTLHEIAVTSAFLIERGEDTAARYLDHFACDQLKSARFFEEHRRALGERSLGKKVLRELETRVDALKQKYGDEFRHDNGWAAHSLQLKKVNFVDIERAVKLEFMRPYYRAASDQVHSSSQGAVMRSGLIHQDPTAAFLLAGPSNYGFADAAMNSAKSLMLATVSLGQVEPTVDTNVFLLIFATWYAPLAECFVKAQLAIEKREERFEAKPRPMRAVRLPSTARRRKKGS